VPAVSNRDTTLLVPLYLDANADRLQEFLTCLERNAGTKAIASVHVFLEQDVDPLRLVSMHPLLAAPNVELILCGRRATFSALFAYANQELHGHRVIIANADIFFDETLGQLDDYDLTGWLLCLSRWDLSSDGGWRLFDFEYSQDAWMFQTPIVELDANFHLGVPGCDNRLAWEAQRAGLSVLNPSRSIRACHLHQTRIRRYGSAERLRGPMRGVKPQSLETATIPRLRAAGMVM
jgi:hypothetical protein